MARRKQKKKQVAYSTPTNKQTQTQFKNKKRTYNINYIDKYKDKFKPVNKDVNNMNANEKRQFYSQGIFTKDMNFQKAAQALHKLTDETKTHYRSMSTYDKEQLISYLKNISTNENNLRDLAWYMYYRSQVLRRMVLYNATMFELDARAIIPQYDMINEIGADEIIKNYSETAVMLDNMNLKKEFLKVFITCYIQDAFYGVAYYDDSGLYILPLPARYCKIVGQYTSGDFAYAFNLSYFTGTNNYLLEYYGEPFQSMYRQYESDMTNMRWQIVPEEYSACFKYGVEDWETIVPPFSGLLNDFISLEDTKNVQAVSDEQDIYKMIYLRMDTLGKTVDDWKVDPDLMIDYFNRMCEDAIPDYTSAAIVPGALDTVSFDDNKTADINKTSNAIKNVLNSGGGAQLLNSQAITGTTGLLAAIKLDSRFAIASLLPQVQGWVNRFISYNVSNPCKVKFFDVSYQTKADFRKEMLEDAQYSLPAKLAVMTLSGFSEIDTLALNNFEDNILKLQDKFVHPLVSSHTQSSDSEGAGRPAEDPEDLTEDGEKSRDKKETGNS